MDETRNKTGKKAAIIAIVTNCILTILNITVGYAGGSYALIAEGLHTFSDVITSIVAYIGFKMGQKPADENHPLGYGRAEPICGLIIVLFLAILGYEIIDTAKELKKYHTTFYTCHCTGIPAYESMRCIMGSQLHYVHCGDEVKIKYQKSAEEERRKQFMKWHKFFAWATVACFIITMMTGYKKK